MVYIFAAAFNMGWGPVCTCSSSSNPARVAGADMFLTTPRNHACHFSWLYLFFDLGLLTTDSSMGVCVRDTYKSTESLQRCAGVTYALAAQSGRVEGNSGDPFLDAIRGVLHLWISQLHYGDRCLLDSRDEGGMSIVPVSHDPRPQAVLEAKLSCL